METILGVMVGVGLAAACGFRVFVPLLVTAVAARAGALDLHDGFAWLATWPALIALATASILEAGAYLVPLLDHALDTIATPAAVVAGAVAAGSQVGDVSPMLAWASAMVGGGVAAGAVQAATVGVRATSTVTTAGLANPVVSVAETTIAGLLASLAVLAPALILAGVVALGGLVVLVILARRARINRRRATMPRGNKPDLRLAA